MDSLSNKAWAFGVLIILLFVVIGELLIVFNDYFFYRLGINRDLLFTILWVLPFIASFVAAYYSEKYKLIAGLSYLVLFPLIGAIAHYINGELGGTVDFVGIRGALTVFKIYLMIGSILIIFGTGLGLALSKRKISDD